jgi:hypothetical protein
MNTNEDPFKSSIVDDAVAGLIWAVVFFVTYKIIKILFRLTVVILKGLCHILFVAPYRFFKNKESNEIRTLRGEVIPPKRITPDGCIIDRWGKVRRIVLTYPRPGVARAEFDPPGPI